MEMSEPTYLLHINGQFRGPYCESLLVEEIKAGRVGKDLSIWNQNVNQWLPIGESFSFQGFNPYFIEHTQLPEDLDQRQSDWQAKQSLSANVNFVEDLESDDFYEQLQKNRYKLKLPEKVELAPVPVQEAPAVETEVTKKTIPAYTYGVLGSTLLAVLGMVFLFNFWQSRSEIEPLLNRLDAPYRDVVEARDFLLQGGGRAPLVFREKVGQSGVTQLRVFANFPDHSRVYLSLVGMRETLIGALHEEAYADLNIKDKTGGTPPILNKEGEPLSPGFYKATLHCLNCTGKNANPISVSQSIAIGIKDPGTYGSELKNFHRLLKSQAESELIEIAEILKIMGEFVASKKIVGQQDKIQKQLESILYSIDESVAQSAYVFSSTYLNLKSTMQLIRQKKWSAASQKINQLQHSLKSLKTLVQSGKYLVSN